MKTCGTLPCESIAGFRLESAIGEGGTGCVYRAWDAELERYIALKVMPILEEDSLIQVYLKEARIAAGLVHKHIVSTFSCGVDGAHAYIVMGLLEGPSLAQSLQSGPLEPLTALKIIQQVTSALVYAHSCGVTHGDVKPSNLIYDRHGDICLVDFGISRRLDDSGEPLGGTWAFMAPELWREERVDPRSDLYALGITLYVMLQGTLPFEGGVSKLAWCHQSQNLPRLTAASAASFDGMQALLDALTAKDPKDRPPTAEALLTQVLGLLAGASLPKESKELDSIDLLGNWQHLDFSDSFMFSLLWLVALAFCATPFVYAYVDEVSTLTLGGNMVQRLQIGAHESEQTLNDGDVLETGDQLRFNVRVSQPSYLALYGVGPSGHHQRLYPEKSKDWQRSPANVPISIPPNWLRLDANVGVEKFVVLASTELGFGGDSWQPPNLSELYKGVSPGSKRAKGPTLLPLVRGILNSREWNRDVGAVWKVFSVNHMSRGSRYEIH